MQKIPERPGVYLFLDEKGKVLYVGKAKNLKKRVSSYFREKENNKVKLLVRKHKKIDYIITNSETEALILENNLIKKHRPRFNIQLKDDKTYPYLVITDENFPRLLKVNRVGKLKIRKKYGPFVHGKMLKNFAQVMNSLLRLRTCRNLKKTPCLRKDIDRCLGPCTGKVDQKEYLKNIAVLEEILKGKKTLAPEIKEKMKSSSEKEEFEKAAFYRDALEIIDHFKKSQIVEASGKGNHEVIAIAFNSLRAVIIVQYYVKDRLLNTVKHEVDYIDIEDLLSEFFLERYKTFDGAKKTIYTSRKVYEFIKPYLKTLNIEIKVPKKGMKKARLELALTNAETYLKDNSKVLSNMMDRLRLKNLPLRIECYDISNVSGQFAVGSMVVFENGFKSSNEYRRFRIKKIKGANDFAMMREVIERRFSRKDWDYPQAVVIDGGKGQLSSVSDIIPESVDLLSIAKRFEIIYDRDMNEHYLSKESAILKLIQNIRDEAHRFAISYYRKRHSSAFLRSELLDLTGIGEKTVEKIMKNYDSYDSIIEAGKEKLTTIIGKRQSEIIYRFLKKEEKDGN